MSVEKKISASTSFKIEDLARSLFAQGDFYVERKNLASLKLFKAGDLIDNRQLQKIQSAKHSQFRYETFIHSAYVEEGIALWEKLKRSETEEVRQESRILILAWFKKAFWEGSEEASLLDLIFVIEKTFWGFERSFLNEYWNTSTMLLKRSALISSLIVPVCLAAGYTDFDYLSDVCHASFLIDCAFELNNFSYVIAQTCEQERQKDQKACSGLIGKEKLLYSSHPQMSYEKASIQCAKYLKDKTVLALILKHHEKTNGTGWPLQISENDSSEVENILISLNQILPYEERDYSKADGCSYLKDLVSKDLNIELRSLPIKRLELLLKSVFEQKIEQAIQREA